MTVGRLSVGVTGHRPNRLQVPAERARARCFDALRALREGCPAAGHVARSPLAEGSDRIFADAALAAGYTLEAVLPFARADYTTTFSDPAAMPEFDALIGRASDVIELPGQLAASKAAYSAVGEAVVGESDIVFAIWDGEPAAGAGGTPEIIAYALGRGVAVLWVNAAEDGPLRLLEWPFDGSPTLDAVREAAMPVTVTDLEALASRLAARA